MCRFRITTAILFALTALWMTNFVQAGSGTCTDKAKAGYPFQVRPAEAFEILATLEKSTSSKVLVSKDEADFFAAINLGKNQPFAEAALLASGVSDAAKRRQYLARIEELETEAKKATTDAKTPSEKGEKLLKFLHAGPMAKGYESKQTDLAALLDSGKFNCVSSATLYNVIGRRLGLNVRAIEVPGHVYSVLYDGDRCIEVQTTNSRGFDPSREERERIGKQTGKDLNGKKNNGREVGDMGLAAIIYYNRGVTAVNEKHVPEAIAMNLAALSLDPDSPSAAANAESALNNWPLELAKTGKYEQAIEVSLVASQIVRGRSGNLYFLAQEWAKAAYGEGGAEKAAGVLLKLQQRFHDDKDIHSVAINHVHQMIQKQAGAGKFSEALDDVNRYRKLLNDKESNEIEVVVYDAWAGKHMKAKEWAKAIEVYEEGLRHLPKNGHLENNLKYCRQEAKR